MEYCESRILGSPGSRSEVGRRQGVRIPSFLRQGMPES